MDNLLQSAYCLLGGLLELLSTPYQRQNFQAMLASRLYCGGQPLSGNYWKSAAALSRFLTHTDWPMQQMVNRVRQQLLDCLLLPRSRGRPPLLQVIVDLTSLPKTGKFIAFSRWLFFYHEADGLHLVVLYLSAGSWRVPWSVRLYRGKGHSSPAQLALWQIRRLPKCLRQSYELIVLADAGFCSYEFLKALRQMRLPVVIGIPCNRKLRDGRQLRLLHRRGQQVYLHGLEFPVWVSWYLLKSANGRFQKRYVLSTRPMKATTITTWGRRRWAIEISQPQYHRKLVNF